MEIKLGWQSWQSVQIVALAHILPKIMQLFVHCALQEPTQILQSLLYALHAQVGHIRVHLDLSIASSVVRAHIVLLLEAQIQIASNVLLEHILLGLALV